MLKPDELCSDYPDSAIATFTDADLEAAVRTALSVSEREDLTCSLVSGLTRLSASGPGSTRYVSGSPRNRQDPDRPFESLTGIQNLTGLTRLSMGNLWITDISALSGLTSLTGLSLHTNWVSDLGPLSGLTNLTSLILSENPISDLSPLRGLTNLTFLRLHRHGDFVGGQLPMNFMGATGLVFTNVITDISPLAGMTKLTDLALHTNDISDISALSGMTALTDLRLAGNPIADLSPLQGLTSLLHLELTTTTVTDLGPLRELTNLRNLDLRYNADLSDIQPLIDNPGLGDGDNVELRFTTVTCADQARLAAKGVDVRIELFSGCITPTRR
jgi:Leucine-rich repeat (LRR) protein